MSARVPTSAPVPRSDADPDRSRSPAYPRPAQGSCRGRRLGRGRAGRHSTGAPSPIRIGNAADRWFAIVRRRLERQIASALAADVLEPPVGQFHRPALRAKGGRRQSLAKLVTVEIRSASGRRSTRCLVATSRISSTSTASRPLATEVRDRRGGGGSRAGERCAAGRDDVQLPLEGGPGAGAGMSLTGTTLLPIEVRWMNGEGAGASSAATGRFTVPSGHRGVDNGSGAISRPWMCTATAWQDDGTSVTPATDFPSTQPGEPHVRSIEVSPR